jgi:Protein of unknown function (DUF5818)
MMACATLITLAFAIAVPAQQAQSSFIGLITDSECSNADHSKMRMEPTDPGCVKACISEHGASYVLYDSKTKTTYSLTDQRTPARFVGKRVIVSGKLDATTKTIRVAGIKPAS